MEGKEKIDIGQPNFELRDNIHPDIDDVNETIKDLDMNKAKEEAERIVRLFAGKHVVSCRNSKGTPVNPYKSNFVLKYVITTQSIEMALFLVDEKIKELIPPCLERFSFLEQVKAEILKMK